MRRFRPLALAVAAFTLAACGHHRPPEVAPVPGRATAMRRPPAPPASAADVALLRSRALMVPVSGVAPVRLPDTFNEGRDGGRRHNAVDILVPRGTPVLSADSGTIYRVSNNRLGGLTVYAMDPERRLVYYYAHLDHYADSLREGMLVARGQVIGYVGTTGNAPPDTPHLHFQVMRLDDVKRYWDGTPLDPRPYFAVAGRYVPDGEPLLVPLATRQPTRPTSRAAKPPAAKAAAGLPASRAATP